MKFCITMLSIFCLSASLVSAQDTLPPGQPASPFKTAKERASYAIGLNIGKSLARDGLTVDPQVIARGIQDALTGAKPLMTEEQLRAAFAELQAEARAKMEAKQKVEGENNLKQGAAFLAANAKKPGVKTLPSGLQYKVIKAGDGATPTATSTVKTHYHGTLLDGTVFDSSYQRNQPAEFPVNGVIKGWTEALQLMKVGDVWELYIPSNLAYGARGSRGAIGPNATLVFKIELLEVK